MKGADPLPQESSKAEPSGTRLDSWLGSYADRTAGMRTSEIRALFSVASRPEVVSLAGGMPNLDALPLNVVAELNRELVLDHGQAALQYCSGQGIVELREQILDVMRLEGIEAHPDDVVVTTGSQQAIDLVTRIFINPGDVIIAEGPSYVGALGVFSQYQADVVHVEMDAEGIIPELLEEKLENLKKAGRTVKFLYTVPNFHNPAGISLSLERRPRILDIAKRYGVLVLEDNPYGLLGFDQEPMPALRSMDPEGVIYLGSFSKTFAPGYRVGWAVAPHAVREKLVIASEATILSPSAYSQMAVSSYLENADWQAQIKSFQQMYRGRRDAMIQALTDRLPQLSWNVPTGGFYVWATLPEGLDAKAMLPRAVTQRVAYVPGTGFYSDGSGHRNMRLSFCYPTEERIAEGIRRLSNVISGEMDLIEIFGSGAAPDSHQVGVQSPTPDMY